ncbi:SMC-Scp complex subunit ScpB [Demequina aurantiaca]|uniref:SMC-Scp complex subunit ScpB n=1 Tax=Demequina aurantiaca TaxID=676200 RepID=UPI003D32CCC8
MTDVNEDSRVDPTNLVNPVEPETDSDAAVNTPAHLRGALEAILMVVDEPVAPADLAAAIRAPQQQVLDALHALRDEYADPAAPRGFELRDVDGRWRIYSSRLYADVVGAFVVDGQSARMSQAALESLAVVAYRQPVTRGQVSQIRGVNVDSVMKTLSARGLITEVGEIGGAVQFGTSTEFLERMGVSSLDELPPLAPYLPELADVDGEAR